jgi:ABC-type cobalamin/Fe3+-siderophores transport system ATPase subunit
VILHDLNLALEWCPRLLLMKGGGAFWQGDAASMPAPEILEKLYDTPMGFASGAGRRFTFFAK